MIITRTWAMPNKNTFSIKPIGEFVQKYLDKSTLSLDPFARDFKGATVTNDMNPETLAMYHMKADEFLKSCLSHGQIYDLVIFDPPYSLRQVKECYFNMGIEKLTMAETQNIGRWTTEKDMIDKILKHGGVVLNFGWNSNGMGKKRAYVIEEILLVAHGSAHYDTICMAERKS